MRNLFILLLFALFLPLGLAAQPAYMDLLKCKYELTADDHKILSWEINRTCADMSLERRMALPLFGGFPHYFTRPTREERLVPYQELDCYLDLVAARSVLNNLYDKMDEILLSDDEYVKLLKGPKKDFMNHSYRVIDRLCRNNEHFDQLCQQSRIALLNANVDCLRIIADDYEEKNMEMPTIWITRSWLEKIMEERNIVKLQKSMDKAKKQAEKEERKNLKKQLETE